MKIFLSSTILDLRDLRDALVNWLTADGHQIIASEKGTLPIEPGKHSYEQCLKAAAECDCLIAVVDGRFGGEYPQKGSNQSITEAEIEVAITQGKKTLVFVRQSIWDSMATQQAWVKSGEAYRPIKNIIEDVRVFGLIDRLRKRPRDNWIFTFNYPTDLIATIRAQIETMPIGQDDFLKAVFDQHNQTALPHRLVGGDRIRSIPQWIGRDQLLTKLVANLGNHKVLVIYGQGGIGKTSLAAKLLIACGVDPTSKTLPLTCGYDHAFYCQVNGSDGFSLITEFLSALDIEIDRANTSSAQNIQMIIAKLHQERWLVAIDNLESLMEEEGAKTKSAEVGDLLNCLAYGGHNSQIIITSRKFPINLYDRRGNALISGIVCNVLLRGIEDADSIQLLKNLGMQDFEADLAWIAEQVKGNVLVMGLLAQLYKDQPGQLCQEPELVTDNAAPIVRKQWEKQSKAAQELLERMCVLRIEVDAASLTTLRLLKSDGEVMEPTREAKKATVELLDGLVNCGLVESNYDPVACKNRYILHRLIAETLQAIFKADLPELWSYAARLYGSFDVSKDEDFRSIADLRFALEELHFYWLIGFNKEELIMIVIENILPKLRQWCYWDLAEEWLNRILAVFTELGDQAGMASSWEVLGDIAHNRGDYDKAESLYNQSLSIFTELGEQAGMAVSLKALGGIAHSRGDYDKAESLYNQSLSIFTELEEQAGIAFSWGGLGNIARSRGDYDKAESLYNQSLSIFTELGEQAGMAVSLRALGGIARKQGDYDKAESLYSQYFAVSTELTSCVELGDRVGMAVSWGCLGENELKRENFESAEIWLIKALCVMEELQDNEVMAEINWDLARLYRATGHAPKAQKHYDVSHELYTKLCAQGKLAKITSEWL